MSEKAVNALQFTKSSYSGANCNCVEVARAHGRVAVRDSKHPSGPVLAFSREIWRDFITDIRDGRWSNGE